MSFDLTQQQIDAQTAKARAGWRRNPGSDSQAGTPLPGSLLSEKDVTRQIRDVLNQCQIFHWKQWQGPMSQPKGVSDILGIKKVKVSDLVAAGIEEVGISLAIEVKAGKGRLTPEQDKFLKRVNSEGGIGIVCYSVESMIGQLDLKLPLFEAFKK